MSPAAPSAPADRRSGRRLAVIVVAAVAVVVGAVAALGGFADVPDERQPSFGLGETFDNGLYRIAFESLEVTDVDPVTGTPQDTPSIVLRARLTFSGDAPARRPYEWLAPLDVRLDPIPGAIVSVRDGSIDPPVQPGLPVDVFYVWDLDEGAAAPDPAGLRVGVYERYLDPSNPVEGATTGRVLVGILTGDS